MQGSAVNFWAAIGHEVSLMATATQTQIWGLGIASVSYQGQTNMSHPSLLHWNEQLRRERERALGHEYGHEDMLNQMQATSSRDGYTWKPKKMQEKDRKSDRKGTCFSRCCLSNSCCLNTSQHSSEAPKGISHGCLRCEGAPTSKLKRAIVCYSII